MKKNLSLLIVVCMYLTGCASPGYYNTQKGAAIGAGLGAITGQAIGRNTEATLLGAGVGTLLGTIFGNLEDQRALQYRDTHQAYQVQGEAPARYVSPTPQVRTDPPGSWVAVPGHWSGNRWIPEHEEWRPINPY